MRRKKYPIAAAAYISQSYKEPGRWCWHAHGVIRSELSFVPSAEGLCDTEDEARAKARLALKALMSPAIEVALGEDT